MATMTDEEVERLMQAEIWQFERLAKGKLTAEDRGFPLSHWLPLFELGIGGIDLHETYLRKGSKVEAALVDLAAALLRQARRS
jgi:hypothetical protein